MTLDELWRRIAVMAARQAAKTPEQLAADREAHLKWLENWKNTVPVYVNAGPSYMEVQAQREIDAERGRPDTI